MKVELCPQCGAPAGVRAKACAYCKAEFVITSISYLGQFDTAGVNRYLNHYKGMVKAAPEDAESQFALGLCYLQLRLFDLAVKHFGRAVELTPEQPDVYYYYGLALIRGRRPKTLSLTEVRQIEQYVNAAMQLDGAKAKYNYLAAILKYEYYVANGLRVPAPSPQELLAQATTKEHEQDEVDRLLDAVVLRDDALVSAIRHARSAAE